MIRDYCTCCLSRLVNFCEIGFWRCMYALIMMYQGPFQIKHSTYLILIDFMHKNLNLNLHMKKSENTKSKSIDCLGRYTSTTFFIRVFHKLSQDKNANMCQLCFGSAIKNQLVQPSVKL